MLQQGKWYVPPKTCACEIPETQEWNPIGERGLDSEILLNHLHDFSIQRCILRDSATQKAEDLFGDTTRKNSYAVTEVETEVTQPQAKDGQRRGQSL